MSCCLNFMLRNEAVKCTGAVAHGVFRKSEVCGEVGSGGGENQIFCIAQVQILRFEFLELELT